MTDGSPAAVPDDRCGTTTIVLSRNEADELGRTLDRLTGSSRAGSILIVDDASTEPAVEDVLRGAATVAGIRVLRNRIASGRRASLERALFACPGDALLVGREGEPMVPITRAQLAALGLEDTARMVAAGTALPQFPTAEPPRPRPAVGSERHRLLFVVHEGGGGAVAVTDDLLRALSDAHDTFCFTSDRAVLRLRRGSAAGGETLREWPLEAPLRLGDRSRADYRRAFEAAAHFVEPELVHVAHLFKHTFDAPRLASRMGIPVVVAFHDHYFLCPTIHLLDENGAYCGGACTPGPGICPTVTAGALPVLKHSFVHQWREDAEVALSGADAFVAPSSYTRDIHQRYLGVARARRFDVIEHGRDLPEVGGEGRAAAPVPQPGARIRIAIAAHLDRHKGIRLLEAITAHDRNRDRRIELHFLGAVPAGLGSLGIAHGRYPRDEVVARLKHLAPTFVGVLSSTAESYSFALSEAFAAGLPVLVTDLGAQAERVRRHGGGFLIAHDDAELALEQITGAADDPAAYAEAVRAARDVHLPGVAEMAARYAELYRDLARSGRRC